jgi:hypothetical protein
MPNVDYPFWFEVLRWAITLLLAGVVWLRKPGEEASLAVSKLAARLDVFEERVKHMPTDEELAQLRGDVSTIKAEVKGVSDLLVRVEHQNTLIHQHLLNNSR